MLHEPQQTLAQTLQPFMLALFEHQHGEQRHQTDDGAQAHRFVLAIGTVQHVVEKQVLLIPQAFDAVIDTVDRTSDIQEMLEKLHRNVDVHAIALGQLQPHAHQVQRIGGDPRGAIGLVEQVTRRQRGRAVEQGNIVQAQEAALEQVAPLGILAVDPPGKIQQQLVEDPLQKIQIAYAGQRLILLVNPPAGPGMHRWVGVVEAPFIGRQLTIGVHETVLHQQQQLLFGEPRVNQRQRHRLETLVPGGIPRVFPGVGHGQDVEVGQVPPMGIADMQALGRRCGLGRVAVEPLVHIEIVELLGPQQPGQCLALHIARIGVGDAVLQGGIEVIGLLTAQLEELAGVDGGRIGGRKTQVEGFMLQPRQVKDETRGDLGACVVANRRLNAVDHVIVDAILERPRRRLPVQPGRVAFVFAEQPLHAVLAPGAEMTITEGMMAGQYLGAVQAQLRLGRVEGPAPVVARPQLRQHLQAGRLIGAVMHGDAHKEVVGPMLGIFDADVAVAVVLEHAGVEDFIFGILKPAPCVFGDQVGVGKRPMRILVKHAHVGMARYTVDEKVQFLDVLTVVALRVVQAEQTLLEDRVALVPQGQAQAAEGPAHVRVAHQPHLQGEGGQGQAEDQGAVQARVLARGPGEKDGDGAVHDEEEDEEEE